ncbi:MAG: hypothetical protein PF569_03195 [Candidatus Woesearchaeota archaeon]|jgi:hypothetical protein|nr:hypothetical protein [Candidatus Woesearchaeota archaeon]
MNWIKRKFKQIKNVIKWMPIIWNQYDFDYSYAIEVFTFKLEQIATFLESDKAVSYDANKNARNIRRVLKILDRVYNEYYIKKTLNEFEDMYGKVLFISDKNILKRDYENTQNLPLLELKKLHYKFFKVAYSKRQKAEKLVWKLIGENIKYWWD